MIVILFILMIFFAFYIKNKILDELELEESLILKKEKYEDIILNIFLKLKNDKPEILETYIEGILSYSSGNRKKNFLKFIMDNMPEITNKTKNEITNKISKKTKDEKTNEIQNFCKDILHKYYLKNKLQCITFFNELTYEKKI